MSPSDIRRSLFRALSRVAPETDPTELAEDVDLRDALDIDSMDFLNVIVALHEDLKVDIAERDYPKLFTIQGAVEYLSSRVP